MCLHQLFFFLDKRNYSNQVTRNTSPPGRKQWLLMLLHKFQFKEYLQYFLAFKQILNYNNHPTERQLQQRNRQNKALQFATFHLEQLWIWWARSICHILQQQITEEPANVPSALINNTDLLEMESYHGTEKSQSRTKLFFLCIFVARELAEMNFLPIKTSKASHLVTIHSSRQASLRDDHSSWIIKVIQFLASCLTPTR